MVEKRVKNPRKLLEKFRRRLKQTIRIQKMILFGSYARGAPRDYSDIDVAVFSPDFKRGQEEDFLILSRIARDISPLIEAFPYHSSELKKVRRGEFLTEIIKTGKVIL